MRGFQTANAAEVTDYKALVCIFMWGGCDTHDVLLPYDQASYDQFRNIRSSLIGGYQGTRDRNQLLPISPTNAADFGGRQFAMPPEMSGLRGLFESGDMAFVANTGPLIRPLNRTQWRNGSVPVPKQLFSHNDQQSTWSASAPEGAQFGWGGRFADAVVNSGANINREFSTITAVGNELFLTGRDVLPYQVGLNGAPEIGLLDDFDNDNVTNLLRRHFTAADFNGSNLIGRDIAQIADKSVVLNESYNRGCRQPNSGFYRVPAVASGFTIAVHCQHDRDPEIACPCVDKYSMQALVGSTPIPASQQTCPVD
jgi:hypothetical protein